jgi:predicted Rossmann fold nucleotide-binding protein DprA/Smf involved in DNA uptake
VSATAACIECLRRARLLAILAPYIERVATGAPGSRSPELLRLASEDLAEAVASRAADRLLSEAEEAAEGALREELERSGCWACCRHDPGYPSGLRDAADAPWALIGRGDRGLLAEIGEPAALVTIVGGVGPAPTGARWPGR